MAAARNGKKIGPCKARIIGQQEPAAEDEDLGGDEELDVLPERQ